MRKSGLVLLWQVLILQTSHLVRNVSLKTTQGVVCISTPCSLNLMRYVERLAFQRVQLRLPVQVVGGARSGREQRGHEPGLGLQKNPN